MSFRKWVSLFLGLIMLSASVGSPMQVAQAQTPAPTEISPDSDAPASDGQPFRPQAALDTPFALVSSGVGDYSLAAPKVFYHLRDCTSRPPALADATASPESVSALTDSDRVSRIAVQGSIVRSLYFSSTAGYCGSLVHPIASNIVADNDNLYWTTNQGLVRLSTNANPGDEPQVLNNTLKGSAELAIDTDTVYVLLHGATSSTVYKVQKSSGTLALLDSNVGQFAGGLQVSHSFDIVSGAHDYVYWLDATLLRRYDLNASVGAATIMSGIIAYDAEGGRVSCSALICFFSDLIFASTSSALLSYNNKSGGISTVYNTTDTIYSITTDNAHVFFLQEHSVPSGGFGGNYTDYVVRHARSNTGTTDFLATSRTDSLNGRIYSHISTDNTYLLWQTDGTIQRLANDAAALPQTNMKITGMSITQGIQKGSGSGVENSVILIQGRRTFVRVFVKSDGPTVSGVTARLYRTGNDGQILDSVAPANSVGTNIAVSASPQRVNLNDSFLFELPWSWIPTSLFSPLHLRAELNPYHAPIESNFGDNSLNSGALAFVGSGALKVQFIAWQYFANNTTYTPRFIKDIIQTYSWLIRAYPIASKIVFNYNDSTTPGLHPNLWFEGDDSLAAKVKGTDSSCQDLLVKNPNGTVKSDDRNLCASRYTDIQMDAMRSDNGIPESRFFYGMIADGLAFPRGQACCKPNVSSGPVGSGTWGWDNDGSYADWYAAHEIGHTLGRAHPTPSAASCGNSASDNNYPYTGGQIGADNNTEGFDAGDPSLGIPRAIYPGKSWYDVMSYCGNQWISDYTYGGMWAYILGHAPEPGLMAQTAMQELAAAAPAVAPASVDALDQIQLNGDFLKVYGTILSGTNTATINKLWRTTSVNATTTITPGGYSIRLLNASNTALSDYPFAPESETMGEADSGLLSFGHIITFAVGTRVVQVVRTSDGQVLASANVSANMPVVSNVTLQGAPNPVTGTVTLNWNASDADGGVLHYDVLYSHDGGSSWVTAQSNLSNASAAIDTSTLGGGTAQFRVIASDGANTGHGDSAPFMMANKPPIAMILTPGETHHIHYGQLVNFSGAALDWQEGGVTGSGLVWTTNTGVLGTGEQVSSDSLPVGTNVITLTATNAAGQSAIATVTVIVDDDLNLLGPTLIAGPTSFNFSFAKAATQVTTDTLYVGNAGDGNVAWSLSVDVPWLTASPITGTNQTNVVLTSDPTGVADGSSLSGTLTLLVPASGSELTQTLKIPVSISKGFDFQNPTGFTPKFDSYLPLVIR